MCGIMSSVIHKVDGAFGAVHQLVARRGQGVGQAVVSWGWCGCRCVIGSLRGLGRAHRRWLRRAAEARGRVVARVAEVRRGAARRRHLLLPVFRLGYGAASAGQPRVCMCSRTARARPRPLQLKRVSEKWRLCLLVSYYASFASGGAILAARDSIGVSGIQAHSGRGPGAPPTRSSRRAPGCDR